MSSGDQFAVSPVRKSLKQASFETGKPNYDMISVKQRYFGSLGYCSCWCLQYIVTQFFRFREDFFLSFVFSSRDYTLSQVCRS
jgi:hypothetical protein